ncbi:hypothetical protein CFP56_019804 [Quercus suber]|uniref:Uncharacterized protein n=1 Tax=Quercus suber TaxID=58331 RepID=A0AAW0LZH6_QUESU
MESPVKEDNDCPFPESIWQAVFAAVALIFATLNKVEPRIEQHYNLIDKWKAQYNNFIDKWQDYNKQARNYNLGKGVGSNDIMTPIVETKCIDLNSGTQGSE